MLEVGVIIPIPVSKVKCVSPTTLVQKAHKGGGLTLEELQRRLNDQCINAGLPARFDLPPRPPDRQIPEVNHKEQKWRVWQNYGELNKVTTIPPMLQGDIWLKQQQLTGQRWRSVFDFASGFYAVKVHEETQPYLAFYMEGRGFLMYECMPFGLTRAPMTFGELMAREMGDLVGSLCQLFINNGGMAADDFEQHIADMCNLFNRVRERKLLLSSAKSSFFMTEATFMGSTVGPDGVKPDLTKLMAIVNWEQLTVYAQLESFLGLTGHFRGLIENYSKVTEALTDLKNSSKIPNNVGKVANHREMRMRTLLGKWNDEHMKCFLELKAQLTSEPVLKGPRFDGSPFIVTSNSSGHGFGGMLCQRFMTKLPSGEEVIRVHPIAFTSKCTSPTEEKYKAFLLEFVALKFSLDKFSDVIWGFPIKIETDCQALCDMMLKEKLTPAHARWRDGIMGHHIIDVQHILGKVNMVGDGISCQWAPGAKHTATDGSSWMVNPD